MTTDQDDIVGFVYKLFTATDATHSDIKFQYFDFPEITSGSSNRFTLTGRLSLGRIPTPPVDLCAAQRARGPADAGNGSGGLSVRIQRLHRKA